MEAGYISRKGYGDLQDPGKRRDRSTDRFKMLDSDIILLVASWA